MWLGIFQIFHKITAVWWRQVLVCTVGHFPSFQCWKKFVCPASHSFAGWARRAATPLWLEMRMQICIANLVFNFQPTLVDYRILVSSVIFITEVNLRPGRLQEGCCCFACTVASGASWPDQSCWDCESGHLPWGPICNVEQPSLTFVATMTYGALPAFVHVITWHVRNNVTYFVTHLRIHCDVKRMKTLSPSMLRGIKPGLCRLKSVLISL